MKNIIHLFPIILISLILNSCSNKYYTRNNFAYPKPVNTSNVKIKIQEKKQYNIGIIHADNKFDGARMNNFKKLDENIFEVTIEPENIPINDSPWFAFRIWSDTISNIYLKIKFINGSHRYIPKISTDKKSWQSININTIEIAKDQSYIIFPLKLKKNKLWISAQPIINSTDVKLWISKLEKSERISKSLVIGKSTLGRDLTFFRIGDGQTKGKKVIVLLSRQHPPETTGFLALKAFINELIIKNSLSKTFFNKYDIWVFPLINPDGVDLGHWRHNANGVDLNRDWAYYRQTETDIVTQYIVDRSRQFKNKVVLGLDFHSTQKDIYYVYDNSFETELHSFIKNWTESIDQMVFPFHTKYSAEPLSKPYSKTWFYKQFKAESLTYEVGDQTPLETINFKAKASAILMMSMLIDKFQ